jgi:hypothetical protein
MFRPCRASPCGNEKQKMTLLTLLYPRLTILEGQAFALKKAEFEGAALNPPCAAASVASGIFRSEDWIFFNKKLGFPRLRTTNSILRTPNSKTA